MKEIDKLLFKLRVAKISGIIGNGLLILFLNLMIATYLRFNLFLNQQCNFTHEELVDNNIITESEFTDIQKRSFMMNKWGRHFLRSPSCHEDEQNKLRKIDYIKKFLL